MSRQLEPLERDRECDFCGIRTLIRGASTRKELCALFDIITIDVAFDRSGSGRVDGGGRGDSASCYEEQ